MSGKYFDVPCGKCSRELHWDDDCAEVPGGAIWCACCIDAKTRHDELASERAAGRREVKDKVLSEIRDRRIEVAGAPIQWREVNELLKRIEALLETE